MRMFVTDRKISITRLRVTFTRACIAKIRATFALRLSVANVFKSFELGVEFELVYCMCFNVASRSKTSA